MRQFGLVIVLFKINSFLAQNELDIKLQGGYAKLLVKF